MNDASPPNARELAAKRRGATTSAPDALHGLQVRVQILERLSDERWARLDRTLMRLDETILRLDRRLWLAAAGCAAAGLSAAGAHLWALWAG